MACTYGPTGLSDNDSVGVNGDLALLDRPPKRRDTGDTSSIIQPSPAFQPNSALTGSHLGLPTAPYHVPAPGSVPIPDGIAHVLGGANGSRLMPSVNDAVPTTTSHMLSRGGSAGGDGDEEAVVYTSARMLQDSTGRLRKYICCNI